eukprot:295249-Amphidinium_carterae.1
MANNGPMATTTKVERKDKFQSTTSATMTSTTSTTMRTHQLETTTTSRSCIPRERLLSISARTSSRSTTSASTATIDNRSPGFDTGQSIRAYYEVDRRRDHQYRSTSTSTFEGPLGNHH